MLAFEQQQVSSQLEILKRDCPDLINDALRYYERAKELHEDNEPEETEHYVTMASVTWRTAERRSLFLAHRQRMAGAKQRYERAQLLLMDAQRRKEALLKMQLERQQLLTRQASPAAVVTEQQKAQEAALKQVLDEAMAAKAQADGVNAQKNAPALYNKGVAALKGVDVSVRSGQLTAATSLARGATRDFLSAKEASAELFERAEAQRIAMARMDELLDEAQRLPSSSASNEARGVVLSISGLFKRGKLVNAQRRTLDQVADLINRYPGLRIMVEAHTYKQRQRQKALSITEGMAKEVEALLRPLLTDPDVKLSTLGRGDYAPAVSNPRSLDNERVDIVFFKPRFN
jgi:outer membrane protein OmpA-like peptidoglycan-associated protein